MARWSRSRLRNFGIGLAALLGGSLLVSPAASYAVEEEPPRASAAAPDRIVTVARDKGRSAFRFEPGSGDRRAPYAFVSAGGTVRARQLGDGKRPAVQAKTGAPVRAAAQAGAAASTYKTTLTVDSQNWTAFHSLWNLWNRDTWTYVTIASPTDSLSTTVDLPPGNYYAAALYGIYGVDSYLLTKAFTVTNAAQTVHLAESSAKEVALKADDSTARSDASAVWMSLPNGDLVGFAGGYQNTRTYVTTASTAGTTLRVRQLLIKNGSTAVKPTPYRYDLVKSWPHPLPASPIATIATASLAKTTTTVRAQGITGDGWYQTVPSTGEWTGVFLATRMRFPATFTEYVTPGVTMSGLVTYSSSQSLNLADRTLPAGTTAGRTVGAGPLVPGRRFYNDDSDRAANRLRIVENMTLGDAAGSRGADTSATTSMTLSSEGKVLKTSNTVSLSADVPQASQTYQLEQTTTRRVAWSQLSTMIRSEWTFASEWQPFTTTLPLMDLAVAASGLDQHNRAGSGAVGLTVVPSTRQTPAPSTVDKIEWSADDGATWTDLPLTAAGEGVEATIDVPAATTFVSLRMTAGNSLGGKLSRTVLRAFAGPAGPGEESAGSTTISGLQINGGNNIAIGVGGGAALTASFTATDPSGIAGGGVRLWHGTYTAPDGVELASATCEPVSATTSTCTAIVDIPDVRYSLGGNVLAGTWQAAAWATAKDGTSFLDRPTAGSVIIKRNSSVTADATPEPARLGTTITVTGTLLLANWDTGTYQPNAARTAALQRAKSGTYDYLLVGGVKSDANGVLKGYPAAGYDASYRYYYPGDATSGPATSAGDYVDVQ